MYTSFFGLTEKPFAITPDPRYLYLSERHAEALAHLAYGIAEAGGFIQLTGEVGTGKTTVLRSLLQQLPPDLNPRWTGAHNSFRDYPIQPLWHLPKCRTKLISSYSGEIIT